jgi:hypothetical protein
MNAESGMADYYAEVHIKCVQELHYPAQSANSATTILQRTRRLIRRESRPRNTADSARDIQLIKRPSN